MILNKNKILFILPATIFCFLISTLPFSSLDVAKADATTTATTTATSTATTASTTKQTAPANINYNKGLYDSVAGTAACAAGQIVGRLISSAAGQAISGLGNKASSAATSQTTDMSKVPVVDSKTNDNTAASAQNTAQLQMKTVGGGNPGDQGILGGLTKSLQASLDSIMYCIVNEVMTYITKSTIQWINNGFQGSPVFAQNSQRMSQTIADREMGNFVYSLSGGVKSVAGGSTSGTSRSTIGMAEPIRAIVTQGLIGSYNSTFSNSMQPNTTNLKPQNYNSCVGGNWNSCGGFKGFSDLADPQYNARGAYYMSQMELQNRIKAQQNAQNQELNRNQGTKSFKTCPQGSTRGYDGSCNPLNSTVTTPGYLINQELQARGMMKYMRVSAAKDFDSVITALVNELVKVAVNKVFDSGSSQGSSKEKF